MYLHVRIMLCVCVCDHASTLKVCLVRCMLLLLGHVVTKAVCAQLIDSWIPCTFEIIVRQSRPLGTLLFSPQEAVVNRLLVQARKSLLCAFSLP